MRRVEAILESFPPDFSPARSSPIAPVVRASHVHLLLESSWEDILQGTPETIKFLDEVMQVVEKSQNVTRLPKAILTQRASVALSDWPRGLLTEYLTCSQVIRSAVQSAACNPRQTRRPHPYDLLFLTPEALKDAIERDWSIPYHNTLGTLLGVSAPSRFLNPEGSNTFYPYHAGRVGWARLAEMGAQMKIEGELTTMSIQDPDQAKDLVAAAWTMVAISSFVDPRIFLPESDLEISSVRPAAVTFSTGTNTHAVVDFYPQSMTHVVGVCRRALSTEIVGASDVMWIGASLSEIRAAWTGSYRHAIGDARAFDLFLSHRGKDSKAPLASALLKLGSPSGVFLDCLTPARGLINRYHVFRSIARTSKIVLVKTDGFGGSHWCRKESWFAHTLASIGLCEATEALTVDQAIRIAQESSECSGKAGTRTVPQDLPESSPHQSGTSFRILRDIEYWARGPNLFTAQEEGFPVDFLKSMQRWLWKANGKSSQVGAVAVARRVRHLLATTVASENRRRRIARSGHFSPSIEVWATAAQLIVAATSLSFAHYSKPATRRCIDAVNRLVSRILKNGVRPGNQMCADDTHDLLLVCTAATLELAGPLTTPQLDATVANLLGEWALLRRGRLFIDVRRASPRREHLLRLLLAMANESIGSCGIIQDWTDPVHETTVDGESLSVLSCVTLYPGMEEWLVGRGTLPSGRN